MTAVQEVGPALGLQQEAPVCCFPGRPCHLTVGFLSSQLLEALLLLLEVPLSHPPRPTPVPGEGVQPPEARKAQRQGRALLCGFPSAPAIPDFSSSCFHMTFIMFPLFLRTRYYVLTALLRY